MAKFEIKKINDENALDGFDCGVSSINWGLRHSYYDHLLAYGYTFMFCEGDNVVGCYLIRLKNIKLSELPENISDYREQFQDCSAVYIKYIAVDSKYQKKGFGKIILQYIIKQTEVLASSLPIRLMVVDALEGVEDWYSKLGFEILGNKRKDGKNPTISMFYDFNPNKEVREEYERTLI